MQTESCRKDYYLRKNFYKQYSQLGTPYIAEYCNVLTSDNLIIYGHHIKNSQMFGELEKYKKKEFYNNHKVISFNTICENTPTEVGAVFNGEYMLTMFLNFYIQLPWIVSVKTSSQVFTPSNQLTLTVKC